MAIIEILPNSAPFTNYFGMATKVLGSRPISIPEASQTNEFCICDLLPCAYEELIFVHSDNSWFKNDKNEFLFKRIIDTDTIALELWLNDFKIEDLGNNDFGTLYDGFASGTVEQQLYYGFLIDWNLVYDTHGVGKYQVKAALNIIGVDSTFESRTFNMMVYSDEAAHSTVRIESTQNGNIIGSQFDFTGLNWYQSLRIGIDL